MDIFILGSTVCTKPLQDSASSLDHVLPLTHQGHFGAFWTARWSRQYQDPKGTQFPIAGQPSLLHIWTSGSRQRGSWRARVFRFWPCRWKNWPCRTAGSGQFSAALYGGTSPYRPFSAAPAPARRWWQPPAQSSHPWTTRCLWWWGTWRTRPSAPRRAASCRSTLWRTAGCSPGISPRCPCLPFWTCIVLENLLSFLHRSITCWGGTSVRRGTLRGGLQVRVAQWHPSKRTCIPVGVPEAVPCPPRDRIGQNAA